MQRTISLFTGKPIQSGALPNSNKTKERDPRNALLVLCIPIQMERWLCVIGCDDNPFLTLEDFISSGLKSLRKSLWHRIDNCVVPITVSFEVVFVVVPIKIRVVKTCV